MQTPILSVHALRALLDSPTLRVVDVRPEPGAQDDGLAQYRRGHIPGAVHLGLERGLSGPSGPGRHPLPEPHLFAERLREAGIGDTSNVVIYDEASGAFAARLWWMLDNLGLDSVSVLDGGLSAWSAAGFELQSETPRYPSATWELFEDRNAIFSKEDLLESLSDFQILDARAAERYRGEHEPIDKIAGHIPTAMSAPFAENLEAGVFKSKEELLNRFNSLVTANGKPVVHSCGSGVTACHNILAMRIAGLGRSALYPGSWSDWSSSGYPVETG